MPQTEATRARPVNHAIPNCVEIDQLDDRLTSMMLGARKSTRAPKGEGESQLRRDTRRGRAKPFAHILKIGFADLRDGESIDDVKAALQAAIDILTAYAGTDTKAALDAYEAIEECIEEETARESIANPLEMAYMRGDRSEQTQQKLARALRSHRESITRTEQALHVTMYRGSSPRAA